MQPAPSPSRRATAISTAATTRRAHILESMDQLTIWFEGTGVPSPGLAPLRALGLPNRDHNLLSRQAHYTTRSDTPACASRRRTVSARNGTAARPGGNLGT